MKLNQYFDHTQLKPDATEDQIATLCREAKDYGFYSVCVNSSYVSFAASQLSDSDVKIAAVVGFPLGACTTASKVFETEEACKAGAKEIDMVLHVGMLKSGKYDYVRDDIAAVVSAAAAYEAAVKVILETCLLTDEKIITACHLAQAAGAAFVKTSTGFSSGGATEHHIRLMRQTVGSSMGVKASGGIRTYADVKKMIASGADRIGASASVSIMKEAALERK